MLAGAGLAGPTHGLLAVANYRRSTGNGRLAGRGSGPLRRLADRDERPRRTHAPITSRKRVACGKPCRCGGESQLPLSGRFELVSASYGKPGRLIRFAMLSATLDATFAISPAMNTGPPLERGSRGQQGSQGRGAAILLRLKASEE